MKAPDHKNLFILACVGCFLLCIATSAHAALDPTGVMDTVLDRFNASAGNWLGRLKGTATYMFWALVSISMVWTFGLMALRKADIGEFFAEFFKFIMFTGFFWMLLDNAASIGGMILTSMRQAAGLAATGSASNAELTPSGIVDIGFNILRKITDDSSILSPIKSAFAIFIGLIICVLLALIAVNMLELIISSWFLAYAGIFFLGFGGSKWTSDIAINYYKSLLGIGAQLMAMGLLVSVCELFLGEQAAGIAKYINFFELGVMLISVVIFFLLVSKIPPMFAGVITGASTGSVGQHGAASAMAAGAMALGAAAGAMKTAAAAIKGTAGGASAVKAAYEKAMGGGSSESSTSDSSSSSGDTSSTGGSSSSSGGDSNAFAKANGGGDGGGSPSSEGSGGSGPEAANDSSTDGGSSADDSGSAGGGGSDSGGSSSGGDGGGSQSSGGKKGIAAATPAAAKALAGAAVGAIGDWAKDKIANTTGGRLAARIRGNSSQDQPAKLAQVGQAAMSNLTEKSFSGNNSLSAAQQYDEAKDFINKGSNQA